MIRPTGHIAAQTGHDDMRLRIAVRGTVQGVGFRPFVHRLAMDLSLRGWVENTGQGVLIEVEGACDVLERFRRGLSDGCPPLAVIGGVEVTQLDPVGYDAFVIRPSAQGGPRTAAILPDIATCADCLRELLDPGDRRFRYPFINCTHCGPRYSIVEALPYDRANTTMQRFTMCAACRAEYESPEDRAFHASERLPGIAG